MKNKLNFFRNMLFYFQRFCLFPLEIVIQFEKRTLLNKVQLLSHQYLIASKIELFIGDTPDGSGSFETAKYTRLGFIELSSNERTEHKARELKSIHVDAEGTFLKFVMHKNYVNKLNLYNQVGLVALNVIGMDPTQLDNVI
jgi:centrosomal protein CEP104